MIFVFPWLFAVLNAGSDRELAGRLKRREPQAMGELYDRYGKLVYSVILRVVKESGVAEDLTQETFVRIWNRAQFIDDEKGSLAAWVLTVARNRAIDYLRSVEGRVAQRTSEFDPALEHPSHFVDLESDIVNSDRARVLRGAMQKLNANQRVVIEMAYYEGLSQSEMAERMKQPLGTVKTWVRSALRVLRDELEQVSVV